MTPAEIERDLAFAIQAARDAGARVLELRDSGRWKGKVLADVGDNAADGYLQGVLFGRYPADGVLSEETSDSPDRLERERAWIIDPLDGTKEFSEGREDWAVHVALTLGGQCALAAVALPAVGDPGSGGQVIWGVALPGHERAGVEGGPGDVELARGDAPAQAASNGAGPRVVVSRSHTPPWVERFGEILGAASLEGHGSAGYKTSRLLLGEADVYVHKVGLKEWDTCAPETVARSLGWHVCKLRGEEHAYNRPDPVNHELVVCRRELTDRVLAGLAESGALD